MEPITAYDLEKLKKRYPNKDSTVVIEGLEMTFDDQGRIYVEQSNYSDWLKKEKEKDVEGKIHSSGCVPDIREPVVRKKRTGKEIARYYRTKYNKKGGK